MNTPPTTLSPRDHEILTCIARGLTRRIAGNRLGITERTVQSRLRVIGQRLGLPRTDQAAIIAEAYRTGLLADLRPEHRRPTFLTHRQREVLGLLGQGLTDLQIGEQLHLSEDTIATHLRHLYDAIGARTRAHAVALDHQHRLRDTDHQLQLYRARFPQRVMFRNGVLVHAWNGAITPCRGGLQLPVAAALDADAAVTCDRCQTALALPQHLTHAA